MCAVQYVLSTLTVYPPSNLWSDPPKEKAASDHRPSPQRWVIYIDAGCTYDGPQLKANSLRDFAANVLPGLSDGQ